MNWKHLTKVDRMGGPTTLERQWMILRLLGTRRFGVTIRELAEEFDTSLKTIRRDLVKLQTLGFPLDEHESSHGRKHWTLANDASVPSLQFNTGELLAMFVARSFLAPLAGTIFWEDAQNAFRKIRSTLSEPAVEYLNRLAGTVHHTSFRHSDYHAQAELIDDLMVAVEDCRVTFITYQSARSTEPLTYDVYPYGLIHHRGSLYLITYSRHHEEVRTFKVDRITDVSLETLQFQKPADFDLRQFLEHSLGIYHEEGAAQRVVIRFAPEVARYVQEHHWHDSQTLTINPDGSLFAEFELTSLVEVKSWVLSFGSKAVVLEPAELREEIVGELRHMLNKVPAEQ